MMTDQTEMYKRVAGFFEQFALLIKLEVASKIALQKQAEKLDEQNKKLEFMIQTYVNGKTFSGFCDYLEIVDSKGIAIAKLLRKGEVKKWDAKGALTIRCGGYTSAALGTFQKQIGKWLAEYLGTKQAKLVIRYSDEVTENLLKE